MCFNVILSYHLTLCFSLSQGKILRLHHCRFRLGLNPVTDVFTRDIRGRFDTQSYRQEAMGWWRQRLEGCGHKSRKAWGPQKMEEARMDSEIINSYCWSLSWIQISLEIAKCAQSLSLTLCGPKDCSPPVLCPWNFPGKNTGVVVTFYSRQSFWPRDWTCVSCVFCIGRWIFTTRASWEA